MIKFVVSRPTRKIHRPTYQGESERRFKGEKKKRIPLKTIWIIFGIFVLIYGSFLLLKNTLFDQEYTITKVFYNVSDTKTYGDPDMYKSISSQIKKENFTVARFNKNTILAGLQANYPFIKDMIITFIGVNTVKVDLVFQTPELLIKNFNLSYGVFRGHIFAIHPGDTLGTGVKDIYMPGYLSGYGAMTGFFFRQSYTGLIEQVSLMYQGFPGLHHIEYLPGGERSIVFMNGKQIYINNLADIPAQIKNYELLKKYYANFNQLTEIDLGSIELDKVIVKK
ncbi:MAG: hypothetical protein NTX91_05045 [candidate division SR1 bacterium]|nr:hypothetical protein [candidate division SR1 bacterium]